MWPFKRRPVRRPTIYLVCAGRFYFELSRDDAVAKVQRIGAPGVIVTEYI